MQVTIKLFAMLGEQLGATVKLDLPAAPTAADIKPALQTAYPAVRQLLATARLAVNQEFVEDDAQPISATDEIALIPPVSGG
ncbi:MoaD/ThiS family protein [Levilactobacillus koreensis]|uniref:Molybdopterin synthase sulfur carrier subunit n=1 Tax=Levilactobacillus koreensis TaxID=637971 RepID=A0AAC8ZG89_9LACO|nr:MoaD/ThiS family protein [Levilactobacillus koreensis]AKP64380.1 molybdenum cofactor biosynthesis protein MoaD [Levilactobacillus koreensis]